MSKLWLLEDLEPFPDRPDPGEVFAPTTYWVDATADIIDRQPVPAAVCSHIPATIRPVEVGSDQLEWVADLGGGFTTLLHGDHIAGDTVLCGCLMWDRYLWVDFRTQPTGHLRLLDRAGHVTQHRHLSPTTHLGWFDVHYDGPPTYASTGDVPSEYEIRLNALEVAVLPT
ncbi:hypothetical protein ACXVUM_16545 [Williamsia sp. SKLECPSW1]